MMWKIPLIVVFLYAMFCLGEYYGTVKTENEMSKTMRATVEEVLKIKTPYCAPLNLENVALFGRTLERGNQ